MTAFRLTIVACWLCFTAPAFAQEPPADDFQIGVAKWEKLKSSLTEVCDPAFDSYEVLQGKKTDYVALVIHGFTLYPRSMDPYVQLFAGLGMNVIAPRLARHHTKNKDRDLDNVSYQEWVEEIKDAYEAATRLGRKVVVVGFSLGGLLGAYTTIKSPKTSRSFGWNMGPITFKEKVDSVFLFSPAFRLNSQPSGGSLYGWFHNGVAGLFRLPPTSLNDRDGLPIGCGHPYYSANAGKQIERFLGDSEGFNGGTYTAVDDSIYRLLEMPVFMGLVKNDNAVDTGMIEAMIPSFQSRRPRYVYFDGGEHGMWTKATTFNLVPAVSRGGSRGQTLHDHILNFWKDIHPPEG